MKVNTCKHFEHVAHYDAQYSSVIWSFFKTLYSFCLNERQTFNRPLEAMSPSWNWLFVIIAIIEHQLRASERDSDGMLHASKHIFPPTVSQPNISIISHFAILD